MGNQHSTKVSNAHDAKVEVTATDSGERIQIKPGKTKYIQTFHGTDALSVRAVDASPQKSMLDLPSTYSDVVVRKDAQEKLILHRVQNRSLWNDVPDANKEYEYLELETLEDLKKKYYHQAIQNQRVQIECFSKVSKLVDIKIAKYSSH